MRRALNLASIPTLLVYVAEGVVVAFVTWAALAFWFGSPEFPR